MTAEQLKTLIPLVYEECSGLNADDLKLCFKNAIKGFYGQVYDRIDAQVIFGWINAYKAQRSEIKMNFNIQKHAEFKQLEAETERTGWTKERLDGIRSLLKEIQATERETKNKKFSERLAEKTEERRVQEIWCNQFYKHKNKEGFVKRDERWMNLDEYLEHRLVRYNKLIK